MDAEKGGRYCYGKDVAAAPGNTAGVIAAADWGLYGAMGAALGWPLPKGGPGLDATDGCGL